MERPTAQRLDDRLHLRHGPIDLIIGADGAREAAFAAAWGRFQTLLTELVAELPLLRQEVGAPAQGPTASRMVAACMAHRPTFVTPMAAVAGAVAEEVLAAMTEVPLTQVPLTRAYVNNGGDIAFHLTPGTRFCMAIAAPDGRPLGRVDVTHKEPARGIATSGMGGRSLSFGIADAVTVLAPTAVMADVAATLIANAVDLPGHPAIHRAPANSLHPDSDLGPRLVTTGHGPLTPAQAARALDRGAATAATLIAQGLALSAALFLDGQHRLAGQTHPLTIRSPAHA